MIYIALLLALVLVPVLVPTSILSGVLITLLVIFGAMALFNRSEFCGDDWHRQWW